MASVSTPLWGRFMVMLYGRRSVGLVFSSRIYDERTHTPQTRRSKSNHTKSPDGVTNDQGLVNIHVQDEGRRARLRIMRSFGHFICCL